MIKISQIGDPDTVLRKKAATVPMADIPAPKIQKIIADMKRALRTQDDAVAIAAPQIGVPLALFVVSGRALLDPEDAERLHENPRLGIPVPSDFAVINPVITKLSRKRLDMEEGCLSVRWLYGKVRRAEKATIAAYDDRGMPFTRGASGLLAQIFQHETDHLEGVIFTDKATDVREILPEKEDAEPS